ncbi:MAG: D-alanyl-D-alanine carboxypeptidase/D-alanyl-D-alanine-endopeptidase [Mediterranea sp.]|jgi:D-alanyl-D-alanine carboxypeptidase/D-alanyl-D-alanine-endopeptidase (penicillin-binding protein 4)|nr:D-alanyl-D-alanine carboxypeptidase/D-alanyl-D-alanine-endopeptidase [Mediterranea sp.]
MRTKILAAALLLIAGLTASRAQDSLQDRLDRLVETALPEASEVGIAVYDLTARKPLYSYQAHKLCRPASTMKLLTVITALSRLKTGETFTTEVWYKGTIVSDTLRGDLYVVGGFDPEFDDNAMDKLAGRVRTLPFSVIKGKVYGDVTMKDSLYWGSGWAWDDNPASFQPYLSPLIYHKGIVKITATPAAAKGEPAILTCEPASTFYTLSNETKTGTPAAGKFSVSRNWLENKNDLVVKGNVDNRRVGEVNVVSSGDFFMHAFIERLQQKGITVQQPCGYAEFVHDATAVHVASTECPLQQVVEQTMKKSDNLNAEALLCKLAGRWKASSADGLAAIKEQIKKVGHDPDNYRIADGCGLSNYNCLSPALLVDFLKYAYSQTYIFQSLYKSLPISGIDGTLQFRMRKGNAAYGKVHAKTGSFTGISALAGYLRTARGHDIAFAIMNQNILSPARANEFQNSLCELLCNSN